MFSTAQESPNPIALLLSSRARRKLGVTPSLFRSLSFSLPHLPSPQVLGSKSSRRVATTVVVAVAVVVVVSLNCEEACLVVVMIHQSKVKYMM